MKHTKVTVTTEWPILEYEHLDWWLHQTDDSGQPLYTIEEAELLAKEGTDALKDSQKRKGK